MKTILTHNLNLNDLKKLKNALKVYGNVEIAEVGEVADLLDINIENYSTIFMHISKNFDTDTLEAIFKYFERIPINIILESESYEQLYLAYRYQVNSVFERFLESEELKRTMIKAEILSGEEVKDFPVSQIVKLYSGPVKIKSNLDYYNRLESYFRSMRMGCRFSMLVEYGSESELYGFNLASSLASKIRGTEVTRRYIGEVFEHEEGGDFHLYCCAFKGPEQTVWLIVECDMEKKNYLFNSLFFKFLESVMLYRAGKEKEKNLELLAKTDEVTGLFNQRKLTEDLESAVKQHEIEHEKFSLMFIDVDHFKSVNDSYGHLVGSKLLLDLGTTLVQILRESDHVYRYGGDEFVVIMPYVSIEVVYDVASRVLSRIKQAEFDIGEGEIYKLSVSIGIAEYPTDAKSATEIIKFADEMMYKSKKSGRGKVFHINEVDNANTGSK